MWTTEGTRYGQGPAMVLVKLGEEWVNPQYITHLHDMRTEIPMVRIYTVSGGNFIVGGITADEAIAKISEAFRPTVQGGYERG